MKKIIPLIVVTLLLFSTTTFAQLFKGGFLLGFNASQVDGDTYSGFNHFGLMGGAFIYTPLTPNIDLQFEIKYMGKGASKPSSSTDQVQITYKNNLNYIELPLLLRYNMRSKFGIEGGLGFAYLFSASISDNYQTYTAKFKTFELSGILGGTYAVNEKLMVDIRFSYSLTPIIDAYGASYSPYFLGRGAFNNVISAGVYYTVGR